MFLREVSYDHQGIYLIKNTAKIEVLWNIPQTFKTKTFRNKSKSITHCQFMLGIETNVDI